MLLAGQVLCFIAVFAVVVLPLLARLARIAWRLPVCGALMAAPVLVGWTLLVRAAGGSSLPYRGLLVWAAFGIVLATGWVVLAATLAGAVRAIATRTLRAPPALPRARIVTRR